MKKQNSEKKEFILNRTQTRVAQDIAHWGKGKCVWSARSWNGLEFESSIAVMSEQVVDRFNKECVKKGLDGTYQEYPDCRIQF